MKKHPILSGILFTVIFVVLIVLTSVLQVWLVPSLDSQIAEMIQDFTGIVYALLLTGILGMSWILYERGQGFFKGCLTGMYLVVVCTGTIVVSLADAYGEFPLKHLGGILIFTADMILIGISEEIIFRGVILTNLRQHFGNSVAGIWKAVIISSVMFALAHVTNVVELTMVEFLDRLLFCFGMGMILAAIYIRCGNIWVVALLHALVDFSTDIIPGMFTVKVQESGQAAGSTDWSFIIADLVYVFVAVYLLRKKKLDALQDNTP